MLRGIPLLVLLFYIYYALGEFLNIPKLAAAVVGFGFSYGAYMADVFRAGVEAIPKEQAEAARSLGMNPRQTLFKIILPQALRTIIPAIGNQTLGMLKDTSLVSVLPLNQLHRDKDDTVGFVDFVNLGDVRVVDCSCGACLAQEAQPPLFDGDKLSR